MKARTLTSHLILLLVFAFAASDIFAANLTVTKTEDTADGVCDTDCSLREAVTAAASGDHIIFSSAFQVPQTIRLVSGELVISKDLRIEGPGSGLLTLSGNNNGRILYLTAPDTIEISGMRLTEGHLKDINTIFGGAIYLVGGTLRLTGLLIDNNVAHHPSMNPQLNLGLGGGIYVHDGNVVIANSQILANTGPDAGGIYMVRGSLTVTDSEISANFGRGIMLQGLAVLNVTRSKIDANIGRGIQGFGSEQIFITDSSVSGNKRGGIFHRNILLINRSIIRDNILTGVANVGSGIASFGQRTTITDSLITGNTINGDGAGIYNSGNILSITRCLITGNRSTQSGAGIRNELGQAYLNNSTVGGNRTGSDPNSAKGGGIRNHARMTITNSTIANNEAIGSGGGIHSDAGATTILRNSLVADNKGNLNSPDFFGTATSQGYNLIRSTNGNSGWLESDLLGLNPLLGPIGFNGGGTYTYALLPGSPAINAGNNDLAVDPVTGTPFDTDQRGIPRRVGGKEGLVDIGAYEADYSLFPVSLTGRLITSSGRGLAHARVTLSDQTGVLRYALTNSSGYFRFLDLSTGQTFTITALDKIYSFPAPIAVTTDQDRDDLIFLGIF